MPADPTSGDPSEFAAIVAEQAWFIADYISPVLLGGQITLAIQSTYYLAKGPYSRRSKTFYIVYGIILAILVTIGDTTNQVEGLLMWINNRDTPGGPEAYMFAHFSGWVNVFGTSAIVTANFMGDALLLYRCYILLANNRLLIVLPLMLLITSTTLAVLTVVESALPNATFFTGQAESFGVPWVALSVTFNVIVTSFICGRILISYFAMKRLGVDIQVAERWGVIAILIESALPFSLFGIVFAVTNGTSNQWVSIFADIWGNIVGLAPQLIILRVAMGHAWTKNSISASTIEFRKGDNATRVLSSVTNVRDSHTEKGSATSGNSSTDVIVVSAV